MTAVPWPHRWSRRPHRRSTSGPVGVSGWTACALVLMTALAAAQQLPSSPPMTTVPWPGPLVGPTPVAVSSASRSDRGPLSAAAQARIGAAIGKDDPAYHVAPDRDGFR